MSIIESIQKAREKGASDELILREIIKQNPNKGIIFEEKLKKGEKATNILNEIIKEEEKKAEEERIKKAKQRIEELKKTSIKKEKIKTSPIEKQFELKEENIPQEKIEPLKNQEGIKVITPRYQQKIFSQPSTPPYMTPPYDIPEKDQEKKEYIEIKNISPEIIRPVPQKTSSRKKILIRFSFFAVFLIILVSVGTFWYWYFTIRNQKRSQSGGCETNKDCPIGYYCNTEKICVQSVLVECEKNEDCPQNKICSSEKKCIEMTSIVEVFEPLFEVDSTREVSISSLEEIKSILPEILKESINLNEFKRIIIKNITKNEIVGIKDFFDTLQIRTPQGFFNTIKDDFTLFIYSQIEGPRIGFAVEVLDKETLENLIRNQESTVKSDYKSFLSFIVEDKIPLVPYFRNSKDVIGYVGPNFRYQTISKNDIGISYLISDKYFIFTTSWKSMQDVIKRLELEVETIEITSELKINDKGEEVKLLQTWLAQDPTVYPERLVTGFFGNLTQKAVIRFQEKYASEILAPQGLVKGTGVVDFYTRMKLNELYGKSGVIPAVPEITKDLRYGDKGDEVKVLQTWLAKNKEIYPQGLVTGFFGPLTQKAVIRFQEKYATEILEPQGLTRGTGIVDALTRKKLNELYK